MSSRGSFLVDLEDGDISDIISSIIEYHVDQKEKEMQEIVDYLEERISDLEEELENLRSNIDD